MARSARRRAAGSPPARDVRRARASSTTQARPPRDRGHIARQDPRDVLGHAALDLRRGLPLEQMAPCDTACARASARSRRPRSRPGVAGRGARARPAGRWSARPGRRRRSRHATTCRAADGARRAGARRPTARPRRRGRAASSEAASRAARSIRPPGRRAAPARPCCGAGCRRSSSARAATAGWARGRRGRARAGVSQRRSCQSPRIQRCLRRVKVR